MPAQTDASPRHEQRVQVHKNRQFCSDAFRKSVTSVTSVPAFRADDVQRKLRSRFDRHRTAHPGPSLRSLSWRASMVR